MKIKENTFETIDYKIYAFSKDEGKYYYLISTTILISLGYLFYSNIIISFLLGFLSLKLVRHYKKFMLAKRRRELNFQFRDLLFSISTSIATGRQIGEALIEASNNLEIIYENHDFINIELREINKRIINSKESIEKILFDFANRCALEDITNFVDILSTCRKTGGDINKVIMKSCNAIMDKISMQREVESLTAQKKLEGIILTSIPLITIFLLRITSPDYIQILYDSFTGKIIMTFALCGIIAAYALIIKITQIDF